LSAELGAPASPARWAAEIVDGHVDLEPSSRAPPTLIASLVAIESA
jgi:hypothetical protein